MTLRVRSLDELPEQLRTESVRRQLAGAAAPAPTGYQPAPRAVQQARESVPAVGASASSLKPRKYRNEPTAVDGIRFDSKLEASCYQWLVLRRAAGELRWFVRQVPFELPGGVRYRCDFLAVLTAGGVEVIDAKGKDTQAGKNKRKQVRALYGVDVELWPKRGVA